jgi:predicted O-methyltransferase YrrM/MoaA/NifB/PqqE/SkfB family radical SAM enzyme
VSDTEIKLSVTPEVNFRSAEVYLFDTCTLKCGYCHLAETGKVLKSADLDPYRDRAYIDRVTSFFCKRTSDTHKWNLMLTGGEPLLMPNFRAFCENLFEKGNRVSLYTALVIGVDHPSFRFLLERGAPEVDYIMASFHPEAESNEEDYWERVGLLADAGHNVLVRFVGHPARLSQLERVSRKCRELDICFYPTTLFSKNYPHSYTEAERTQLASHFSSLSQAIQLSGGISTEDSKCFAGSQIIAVHLPSGDIWPCISVHRPVLGNVYEDRLDLLAGAIDCPEAGIACVCDIHFQQNIVAGTDDHDCFELQKKGFVEPMPTPEQSRLIAERRLHFTEVPKGIGNVEDDKILFFSKKYVKEQFVKNFSTIEHSDRESIPDIFLGAVTSAARPHFSINSEGKTMSNVGIAATVAKSVLEGRLAAPNLAAQTRHSPSWPDSLRARRPAITQGFVMPSFAGRYWIWPEEYALLAKYVDLTQGNYLEIGSMCGIIAMSLAEKYPGRQFTCVDAFVSGHGTIAGEKETFLRNLREHNLKNVGLIEGDSLGVVPTLSGPFDVIFIDGNHSYEYVFRDALNCWRLLAPNGFIVFHDYGCVEETTQAVNQFLSQTGAQPIEKVSSVAVLCKPHENDSSDDWNLEIERLRRLLDASEQERTRLAEERVRLQALWQAVERSAGWRVLNSWRRAREKLVPVGSHRRTLYDGLVRSLRGKS